jgi:hypothetical protein
MIASIQSGAKIAGDSKTIAATSSQLFADALGAILGAEGQLADNPTFETSGSLTKAGKSDSPKKSEGMSEDPEVTEQAATTIVVPTIVPQAPPLANTSRFATSGVKVPAESSVTTNQVVEIPASAPASKKSTADQVIAPAKIQEEPADESTPVETPARGLDVEPLDQQPITELIPELMSVEEPVLVDAERSTMTDKPEELPMVAPQHDNPKRLISEISSLELPRAVGDLAIATKSESCPTVPALLKVAPKAHRQFDTDPAPEPSDTNEVAQIAHSKIQFSTADPDLKDEGSKTAVLKPQPETPREAVPEPPPGDLPASTHRPTPKDGNLPVYVDRDPAPGKTVKFIDAQLINAQSQQATAHHQPANDRTVEPAPTIFASHVPSESGSSSLKQNDPAQSETAQPRQEPLSPQLDDLRSEPGAIHLVSKLERQELRFGWNSKEFGRIEVRTILEHDRVGAVVSVPDAHLRDSLQAEIGSLNRALAGHSLELSQFSAFDSSTSRDANREPYSQPQTGTPIWNASERNQASSLASKNVNRAHAGLLDLRA